MTKAQTVVPAMDIRAAQYMPSLLFTIQVSAEYQQHGDGNDELYVAQAIAPNGEKLHYRGEGTSLCVALEELAKQVRRQSDAFAHH